LYSLICVNGSITLLVIGPQNSNKEIKRERGERGEEKGKVERQRRDRGVENIE